AAAPGNSASPASVTETAAPARNGAPVRNILPGVERQAPEAAITQEYIFAGGESATPVSSAARELLDDAAINDLVEVIDASLTPGRPGAQGALAWELAALDHAKQTANDADAEPAPRPISDVDHPFRRSRTGAMLSWLESRVPALTEAVAFSHENLEEYRGLPFENYTFEEPQLENS
ncbi:MAG: hypothetical protein ACKV2V_11510, partial [Blastocatellia bacterium]